jgi:2-polyprenyl-3-methyl-5-hydroxy-6-metoxy-1,4-benzoquinol methylase
LTKSNKNHFLICENCQNDQFSPVFTGSDKLLGIPGKFEVCECRVCGLYQIFPKLSTSEMEQYYPADYICYLEAIEDEEKPFTRFNRFRAQRKRCRQIERRTEKKGKILDIGCATGIFLNEMQKRDWDCKGIEPDQEAADYAQSRFGLDVFHGVLENSHLPSNTYDVVSLWDVLEHVYDLKFTISEIFRVLKPGGMLIATLPNAIAFERYIFGKYWVGWEVPRHYRTFTPKTIKQFLGNYKFTDIEIFSFTGRHGAFMLSVAFWLSEVDFALWKKKLIRIILGSIIFRIISLPVFISFEFLNRSTVMSFSARKPKLTRNNP